MKKIKISSSIVDIVATGSGLSKKKINEALKKTKALGFTPRLLGSISNESGLFAQSEKFCFENFKKALFSKDSQMIWCLRGGYGSQRLLRRLDQIKKKPPMPKLFIGYSDVTVIHDWIHHTFAWPSLHFPVLSQITSLSSSSLSQLRSLFFQSKKYQIFSGLRILNPGVFKKNIVSKITGGNLTMIRSSIGTPWEFSRKNQILFLEDNSNEKPHTIDRALWQIRNSGGLKGLSALVFGKQMINNTKELTENVLKPFAKKCSFPVLEGLPCGHNAISHPLPFLTRAELTLNRNQAELKVETPFMVVNDNHSLSRKE